MHNASTVARKPIEASRNPISLVIEIVIFRRAVVPHTQHFMVSAMLAHGTIALNCLLFHNYYLNKSGFLNNSALSNFAYRSPTDRLYFAYGSEAASDDSDVDREDV